MGKSQRQVYSAYSSRRSEGGNKCNGLQPEQDQAFQRCEPLRTEQRVEAEKARNKRSE
jgi:hypothetical protein